MLLNRPSGGKLLANMQRSGPKSSIVPVMNGRSFSTVQSRDHQRQARELDHHVRAFAEPRHALAPEFDGGGRLLVWHAGVVENDLDARVPAGEVRGLAELVVKDLQVEGVAALGQKVEAPVPGRICHVVGAVDGTEVRVLVPVLDVPDAAHVGAFAMRLQQVFEAAVRQVGVGDDAVREAVPVGHALHPAGLAHRV